MPGIHLCFQQNISKEVVSQACHELMYRSGVKVSEWVSLRNATVLFSSYDGYPCSFLDSREFLILIEGLIYDRSDTEIKDRLTNIAKKYLAGEDYKSAIINFISSSDGDFLILIYFKSRNDAVLFNDRWGRLPTFYYESNGMFILSREIKFILHWLPSIEINKDVMAQFLSFEYNLGENTLIKHIDRFRPGSVVKINLSNQMSEMETLFPIDFTLTDPGQSQQEVIDSCIDLFDGSIRSRIEKLNKLEYNITADLSAGFDTRAVVAGLKAHDADFVACSDKLATGDETAVAQRVAILLGVELLCFNAQYPVSDFQEMARLTYLTDGLINCFTTLTCFYDDIERDKNLTGRYANFMGFGGEFIRHPLKPKSGYRNLHEMIADNAFSSFLDIGTACRLLDIEINSFLDRLGFEIDQFPENNLSDQMKHLFFELHRKQVIGGEDRHRLFRWTVQPLWGSYLFDFEMHNIPLEIIDDNLFFEFLRKIDPRTLNVPFQNKRISPKHKFNRFILNFERQVIKVIRDKRLLSNLARLYNQRKNIRKDRKHNWDKITGKAIGLIERNKFLEYYFNTSELIDYLDKCRDFRQFYQIMSMIFYLIELNRRFGEKMKSTDST